MTSILSISVVYNKDVNDSIKIKNIFFNFLYILVLLLKLS